MLFVGRPVVEAASEPSSLSETLAKTYALNFGPTTRPRCVLEAQRRSLLRVRQERSDQVVQHVARKVAGRTRPLPHARDTCIALVKLRSSLAVPDGGVPDGGLRCRGGSLGRECSSPPASCRNTVVKTAALVTGGAPLRPRGGQSIATRSLLPSAV